MGISAIIAFMIYTIVFYVGQSIIASKKKIVMISRKEAPIALALRTATVAVMPWALVMSVHQETHVSLVVAGCVFLALGCFVSLWGQWTLGKNWVPGIALHKRHQLVTTGPYRFVRHPLYSGILLGSLGVGICSLNIAFLATVLIFSASFAVRCPFEDELLAKRFPKQFPAYANRTGALVPRIRR